jgi:hypothetical protein
MKLLSSDKSELMTVSALDRIGSALLIKGKVFGAMPMTAVLTPEEARKGLKLLCTPKMLWFMLTFLFRGTPINSRKSE